MAAFAAAAPGASAAPNVVNCSTTDLQTAINNAAPGATLVVTGTCLGNYTINQSYSLLGRGNAVLDGQNSGTTLTVSSGATVQVSNMTITHGNTSGDGGAVNNSGTLTLSGSTVNNSTGSSGGGIFSSGTLTVKGTTVSGNTGTVFGGGIYNNGTMTVQGTKVSGNSAVFGGGGILTGFGFGPVAINGTTISGNTATSGSGGGVFNILDSVTLTGTSVTGNTAALEGGGINNNAGTTTLNQSSVTNNTAQMGESGSFGGGVFTFSGSVFLNNSSVKHNVPDNCDPPGVTADCTG